MCLLRCLSRGDRDREWLRLRPLFPSALEVSCRSRDREALLWGLGISPRTSSVVSVSAAWPLPLGFGDEDAWAASFSFVLLYISFLVHRSQRTTLTNALFDSPFSIYAKGSSTVLRRKALSSGSGAWRWHLVLPHVVSPEPDRTSDSVRQRRLNWFCELDDGTFHRGRLTYIAGFVVFEVAYGEFFV